MKKILFIFCAYLLITYCAFSQLQLGTVRSDTRISYFGYFDPVKLEQGGYSAFTADYLFGYDFYEFSFYKDVPREPSQGFSLPQKIIDNEYTEQGTWNVRQSGYLDYLNLKSNTDYTYYNTLGIIVHKRRMYLYHNDRLIFSSDDGLRWGGLNPMVESVDSSSFLVEETTQYNGDNFILARRPENRPWVEGVDGDGVGEWVQITTQGKGFPLAFFLFSNGYVNFNKPYLYEYNSRVKKIRVEIPEHDVSFDVELKDTPQFQEVRLPQKINDDETTVRFTILDVYPGEKWDDTCINLIVPLGDLPD